MIIKEATFVFFTRWACWRKPFLSLWLWEKKIVYYKPRLKLFKQDNIIIFKDSCLTSHDNLLIDNWPWTWIDFFSLNNIYTIISTFLVTWLRLNQDIFLCSSVHNINEITQLFKLLRKWVFVSKNITLPGKNRDKLIHRAHNNIDDEMCNVYTYHIHQIKLQVLLLFVVVISVIIIITRITSV